MIPSHYLQGSESDSYLASVQHVVGAGYCCILLIMFLRHVPHGLGLFFPEEQHMQLRPRAHLLQSVVY